MTRNFRLILAVAILLLIAVGAYFWATGIIDSTYAYRSALKDNPPQPAPSTFQPATRRVVFVLIDGLRLDTSLKSKVMPVLNKLRQQGASASMHSQTPSFSEPGYSTLLTGAWPFLNDGPALNKDYEDIPTFTQDNLYSSVSRSGKKTAISAYYWFEKLVPQAAVHASFYTPGDDRAADREVMDAALMMLKDPGYSLVLVHLDQVDYAGHHEGGPRDANWDAAASRADGLLGELLAQMDLQKDTVLVVSDHGHIDQGGHGGPDPVALVEPFILAGAAVKPGAYGDVYMVDVAPTIAALLGANLPASTQGSVRSEMLNLSSATQASLPAATRAQQTSLVQAYTNAIGQPSTPAQLSSATTVAEFQKLIDSAISARLTSERLPRLLLALVLVAGGGFFLARQNKRKVIAWLGGGLLAIALFHLRFAVLDGKPYSLSGVTGQMDLILYVAVTTALTLLIGWLLTAFGLGVFRCRPLSAAEGTLAFILVNIGLLALPVLAHFVLNDAMVGWMLPEMYTAFIALISLIQILITAILGLLLAGLSALIGLRNPITNG